MFEVDVKSMELDPMCLLLALPDGHIVNVKHKSLFHLLTVCCQEEYSGVVDQGRCSIQNDAGIIIL